MSTATAVTMLDVRAGSGAITLPLTTQIPYRVITIKDTYGAAAQSSITINTQGTDVFENGASSITLTNAYDTTTLYAGLPGYWYTIGGSRLQGASFNTLSTGLIANPLRIGTLSTQTAIQFPGLRQNYTGTAITEQTTGVGTQELLLYKASSISDQIRLQTTGNVVFEVGASARSWPSAAALATPTLYIQGSTSNVGIGTATPAATLDVAGSGRFQTLSTLAINVSSINGIIPGAAFIGSTNYISATTVQAQTVSTQALNVSTINGQTFGAPIQSTVIGLGNAGYISTSQLISTTASLNNYISTLTTTAGNTTGTILYLNQSLPTNGYSRLDLTTTTTPTSSITTSVTKNTSNTPIAQFQTDFTLPAFIPAGFWDVNLFAYNTNTSLRLFASLYTKDSVETLLATAIPVPITTAAVLPYTVSFFVPYTIPSTGSALVMKLFANNVGNQDQTLTTYYEGSNYSHVHTTFGTIIPDAVMASTVTGLGRAGYISTLTNVPYISAQTIQTSTLNTTYFSSVQGYVSSLRTDSLVVGGPAGYVTIQDLTTGTVSTGQIVAGAGFISSLQINTLSFGPSGYVIVTNFIANTLSTTKLNAQNIYANNLYVGNTSTQSAILFPGIDGTYKGTAIAEQRTGVGTEELLLYKVSTATDQIRLQTTGNIVFETGAAARSWPSTAALATPTLYIQGSTSNVGVGTAAPAATLDVAGTGRFQIISSLTLNVSSINGAAPGAGGSGTTFNGSTLSLSAATIFVSSLVTTSLTASTALIVLNGSTAPTSFGQGVDTLTLQASNSYVGAVASMAFATATVSYPLARIYALDSASSGPALSQLVFQTVPTNASSFSSTFSYTGANQTFTVPAGVTTISVTLWGAGGSGSGVGGIGGAGAFIQGTLSVTPGQTLILVVGQGGVYNSGGSTYGGGGGNLGNGNAGGGRSAIQTTIAATITTATGSGTSVTYTTNSAHGLYANQPVVISNLSPSGYNGTFIVASILSSTQFTVVNTTTGASSGTGTIVAELVDVGGGGGAGASNNAANGGAASYSGTASTGVSTPYNTGGGGGSQTAGGAAATSTTYGTPTAGTVLAGGAGSQYGSGGGGGYYGGGGSSAPMGGWCSGAGGGSSFTSYSGFTLLAGSNSTNGTSAPATGYNGYQAGVAAGGATSTNGGSGLILLASIGNALAEAMRIATTGYVGIGTAAPATLLDVAGTARATTISSLALQTSSINGAAPWQPSFLTSTVQGLGTAGYLSSTQILNTSKIVGLSSLLSYSYVTYNVTTPIASTSVPGIAVDKTSTYLYYGNAGYIYKYTLATGTAAAFVGNGTNTFQDGTGTSAGLTSYGGALCIDPTNTIMYAFDGTRIRKIILSSGVVTTIAGNGTSSGTAGTVDGTGTGATISYNRNTALNASGTILYWMDYASNGVYLRQCVLSTGVVTTLAGRTGTTSINGYGLSACFGINTQGLAIDSAGNIYISDLAIPGIRIYTPSDGYVSGGISGISQAGLSLCVDSFNQLWIPPWTPSMSGQIVVYNLTTKTSFIVGSGYGPANGSQTVAQFGAITPIVADTLGNIYIGEFSAAGGYQDAVRFIKATTNYSTIQVQGTFNLGTLIASAATVGAISTLSISTGVFTASGTVCTPQIIVSTINGLEYTTATPFTGSTLSLSTASVFTSSLRASTISVGGGAWMSNDGLYLSNVQAGGAVGKLITNAGYVKLVTATAWNGGYGAFAITGGDLTPKIYMNAGQVATGAQIAIGGLNPSPGAGISLDVFGTGRFSSISTFQAVTSSIGVGTATPQALLDVAGTGRFQFISTLSLQTSSINGAAPWQQSYLTSTTEGLGTLGYISSTQLGSTVTNLITRIGAGGGGGTTFVGSTTFLSASQILFSTQTGYNISSVLGYVSSLQVDELQIGTGFGIIAFGDTNMSSISTLGIAAGLGNFTTINVSSINGAIPGTGSGTTFTGTLGTVSSLTALRFYGLTGTYANTAVAEVSTGTGNQELLLYKVSSIADQVRVQTTGNVIFETGVGARGWPTASRATVPTFYIAGSNSNVGVGTSNPVTTLDVAGTGRFQTLSSLNITAGSINYSVAFV